MERIYALQMTVVEAYVGKDKMNEPYDQLQLNHLTSSLLSEGVAQNTTGNVFMPKVSLWAMKVHTYSEICKNLLL